jgi:hypothetical protein
MGDQDAEFTTNLCGCLGGRVIRARSVCVWSVAVEGVARPVLAMSLNNLNVRLAEAGRRDEALVAIEEAGSLRAGLSAARLGSVASDRSASPFVYAPSGVAACLADAEFPTVQRARRRRRLGAGALKRRVPQVVLRVLRTRAGSMRRGRSALGRLSPHICALRQWPQRTSSGRAWRNAASTVCNRG